MTTFTRHFRWGVPDFDTDPWHAGFASLVSSMDRTAYGALIAAGATPWANNTAYLPGDIVTDTVGGGIWICDVGHTSAVSPTTFAADRVAHPTFWVDLVPDIAAEIAAGDAATLSAATALVSVSTGLIAWSNTRLAKTTAYSVTNADKAKTIALGGAAFYALTFAAASGYDANFAVMVLNEDTGRAKTMTIDGLTSFLLYPGQSIIVYNQNNVWKVHGRTRWKLTGALSVFVNTGGAATNDGLATGTSNAFGTIQQAFDHIANNYDMLAGSAVTINLAAQTHTVGLHASVKPVGAEGGAQIIIDGGFSGTCTLSTTSADCIAAFVDCTLQVRRIKLQTTTSGSCISAGLGARVYLLDDLLFGACATYHITVSGFSQVLVQNNYQIQGGALAHYAAPGHGSIEVTAGITVTWGANTTFTQFALVGQQSAVTAASVTYNLNSFTVTGQRFSVANNGVLNAGGGGANYFPGNSAGVGTNSGTTPFGLYI